MKSTNCQYFTFMTNVIFNICLLEYSRNSIHEINSSVGHAYIHAAGDKQIVLLYNCFRKYQKCIE